jgi:hypothetical protein
MMLRTILCAILVTVACVAPSREPGDDEGGGGGGDGSGSGSGSGSGGSGSGSGSGSGGGSTGQVEAFVEQLVGKLCAHAMSCRAQYPAGTGATFEDEWGADQNDCVTGDEDYEQRTQIAQLVATGKLDFDATAAAECLGNPEFPAACSAFFTDYDWPDACYDALAGNTATGGACTTYWECSADDTDCVAGTCQVVTD